MITTLFNVSCSGIVANDNRRTTQAAIQSVPFHVHGGSLLMFVLDFNGAFPTHAGDEDALVALSVFENGRN